MEDMTKELAKQEEVDQHESHANKEEAVQSSGVLFRSDWLQVDGPGFMLLQLAYQCHLCFQKDT